jgi:protein-disulfide isomerase
MKRIFTIFALVTGLAFTFTANLVASSAQDNQENTVVAQVGATKLTAADLEKKEAGSLLQARYQLYVSERKVLDQFVDKEILELQAKSKGLTVDQLLEKEAYKNIKDPTEDQLEVYYEGAESDLPFATVKTQILDHIRQLRRSKARAEYVKNLRTQANIRILLAPPTADVNTQDAFVHGSNTAPVALVEFADYECPYCSKVNPVLQALEKEYGSKLAVIYKDFPLPMHKDSEKAAEGARCAGDQGKYWEYHDLLFTSHQLDIPSLKKHADELKLDQAKFDQCLDSGSKSEAVKKDLEEGQKLGLTGTPSFFVNGHFFSGAADSAMLHEIVGMEMPASSSADAPAAPQPAAIAEATASRK